MSLFPDTAAPTGVTPDTVMPRVDRGSHSTDVHAPDTQRPVRDNEVEEGEIVPRGGRARTADQAFGTPASGGGRRRTASGSNPPQPAARQAQGRGPHNRNAAQNRQGAARPRPAGPRQPAGRRQPPPRLPVLVHVVHSGGKGGAGKTFLAANQSAELAKLLREVHGDAGRVLLIGLDISGVTGTSSLQTCLSGILQERGTDLGVGDLIINGLKANCTEHDLNAARYTCQTTVPGLDVMLPGGRLEAAQTELSRNRMGGDRKLSNILNKANVNGKPLKDYYTVIVIDTAGSTFKESMLVTNALMAAHSVACPLDINTPETFRAKEVIDGVQEAQQARSRGIYPKFDGFVINMIKNMREPGTRAQCAHLSEYKRIATENKVSIATPYIRDDSKANVTHGHPVVLKYPHSSIAAHDVAAYTKNFAERWKLV